MMLRAAAPSLLVLVVLVAACHAGGAAGAAAKPAGADDPTLVYDEASQRAGRGDRDGALALLERLDAGGWSFCPADRDMPGLVGLPRYRELCARMAARGPRVERATVAMTLADPGLAPEGIAYDDDRQAVFVGSVVQRKIVRIGADGVPHEFATRASGLYAVLGVRVDAPHGLLWAASAAFPGVDGVDARDTGKSALFAFDLESGALREQLPVNDGRSHQLNDVAIGPDGAAYVTDTEAGVVWRHLPGGHGLEQFLPAGSVRYANGIACDGTRLLVAYLQGIAVVPLAGGERAELTVPPGLTLGGLDGLYVDDDLLLGIQNGFGSTRVVRADLDARHATALRVTVLESAHPALATATTGALVRRDRRLLVIAQGDRQPPTILSVPIDP